MTGISTIAPAAAAAARLAASPSQNEPVAGRDGRAGEGADHVERAMGEVDQAHDAEDQRQPGRHQEQHDAELQAVEKLFDEECDGHAGRSGRWRCGTCRRTSRPQGGDCGVRQISRLRSAGTSGWRIRAEERAGCGYLHRALLGIGVGVVVEGGGDDLVGQHVAFLHHFAARRCPGSGGCWC